MKQQLFEEKNIPATTIKTQQTKQTMINLKIYSSEKKLLSYLMKSSGARAATRERIKAFGNCKCV